MVTYEDVYHQLIALRKEYSILATDNSRLKSRKKRYERIAKLADIISKEVITKTGMIEDGQVLINLSLETLIQLVGVSKQTLSEYISAIQYGNKYSYKFAA